MFNKTEELVDIRVSALLFASTHALDLFSCANDVAVRRATISYLYFVKIRPVVFEVELGVGFDYTVLHLPKLGTSDKLDSLLLPVLSGTFCFAVGGGVAIPIN